LSGSRRQPEEAYLSLGSNIGDREEFLAKARRGVAHLKDTMLLASSIVFETPPLGRTDQPFFLNQVLKVTTMLSPHELIEALLALEASLGRKRAAKWGPRTIDIDILLYGNTVVKTPSLVIPHPELLRRPFLVYLLVQLDSDVADPVSGTRFSDIIGSWSRESRAQVGQPYRGGA
jgi:2-amino-4-hydroxy-6-hydroxymethyldihydropteridine diphosphokinase